jgi:hypothetical protein
VDEAMAEAGDEGGAAEAGDAADESLGAPSPSEDL